MLEQPQGGEHGPPDDFSWMVIGDGNRSSLLADELKDELAKVRDQARAAADGDEKAMKALDLQ